MNDSEVAKYKKKSKKTGLHRSKHKHQYETVLLKTRFENPYTKQKYICTSIPTKVCVICKYIGHVDRDKKYFDIVPVEGLPYRVYETKLTEAANKLPVYSVEGFNKFATEGDFHDC